MDEQWGLNASGYSDSLCQQMVWLSGVVDSYEQAEEVFARIGHRSVPRMSVWRQAQVHGERMGAYLEHQQELVGVERVVLPPPGLDHEQRKGVSLDGGMVNIRDEGWKEFKVGAAYDVVQRPAPDPVTGELVEQAHGVNIAYTAVLGPVERFAPALWAAAVAHQVPQAADTSVTADGAEWIWNLADDYFPDSVQIVDWYHACEHLSDAASALYPDDHQTAQDWYKRKRAPLFKGNIHLITRPLDEAGLSNHSQYFHTHQRRMQYQEFREEGYPIGSGTVESGIKQIKGRLTGPGMRWSRPGAEHMLLIRSAVIGQTFDALWAAAA